MVSARDNSNRDREPNAMLVEDFQSDHVCASSCTVPCRDHHCSSLCSSPCAQHTCGDTCSTPCIRHVCSSTCKEHCQQAGVPNVSKHRVRSRTGATKMVLGKPKPKPKVNARAKTRAKKKNNSPDIDGNSKQSNIQHCANSPSPSSQDVLLPPSSNPSAETRDTRTAATSEVETVSRTADDGAPERTTKGKRVSKNDQDIPDVDSTRQSRKTEGEKKRGPRKTKPSAIEELKKQHPFETLCASTFYGALKRRQRIDG